MYCSNHETFWYGKKKTYYNYINTVLNLLLLMVLPRFKKEPQSLKDVEYIFTSNVTTIYQCH